MLGPLVQYNIVRENLYVDTAHISAIEVDTLAVPSWTTDSINVVSPATYTYNGGIAFARDDETLAVFTGLPSVPDGTRCTAIGPGAGASAMGNNSVAIGSQAGASSMGLQAVAIGYRAGETAMGANSVAIGSKAGATSLGQYGVAIGSGALELYSSQSAIGIGANSSVGCPDPGIAIGTGAQCNGNRSTVIGAGTQVTGTWTVVVGAHVSGPAASIKGGGGVILGADSRTDAENNIIIGRGSTTVNQSIFIIGDDVTDTRVGTPGNIIIADSYVLPASIPASSVVIGSPDVPYGRIVVASPPPVAGCMGLIVNDDNLRYVTFG